jgi:hypothetical protein
VQQKPGQSFTDSNSARVFKKDDRHGYSGGKEQRKHDHSRKKYRYDH